MYTISVSAATSLLITTSVRDNPFNSLYEDYAFVLRDEQTLRDVYLMVADVSTDTSVYQHFDVVGADIALPLGTYAYKLYTASGNTSNDIIYTDILEQGFIKLKA